MNSAITKYKLEDYNKLIPNIYNYTLFTQTVHILIYKSRLKAKVRLRFSISKERPNA
jgi:hypothetical protein